MLLLGLKHFSHFPLAIRTINSSATLPSYSGLCLTFCHHLRPPVSLLNRLCVHNSLCCFCDLTRVFLLLRSWLVILQVFNYLSCPLRKSFSNSFKARLIFPSTTQCSTSKLLFSLFFCLLINAVFIIINVIGIPSQTVSTMWAENVNVP